jgi:hypothetical protein
VLRLLVESSLRFAKLIPQGQGKVPRSKALQRTTLPAPNLVLTLAVLGATCRGSTVIQRGSFGASTFGGVQSLICQAK